MKRRQLLQAAAEGSLIALWPKWIRKAFAEEGCDDGAQAVFVSAAFRRAQKFGKPLLVFVIPADNGARYSRGHIFGEFLNHGSDADLAPLALTEVVAAKMADLKSMVPNTIEGEPLVVLVETGSVPATTKTIELSVIDVPEPAPPQEYKSAVDYQELQKKRSAQIHSRIARFGEAVRGVLTKGERLTSRVAQTRAAISGESVHDAETTLARGLTPDDSNIASLAYASAQSAPEVRKLQLLNALADAARQQWVKKRVPGSKWANSGGCGMSIEGETNNMMMACGMGMVVPESARFLYFFTDEERHPKAAK